MSGCGWHGLREVYWSPDDEYFGATYSTFPCCAIESHPDLDLREKDAIIGMMRVWQEMAGILGPVQTVKLPDNPEPPEVDTRSR